MSNFLKKSKLAFVVIFLTLIVGLTAYFLISWAIGASIYWDKLILVILILCIGVFWHRV